MKNEKVRNGVRTSKHFAKSIKISEDGLLVEKEFIDHENGNRITRFDFFNHESKNSGSIWVPSPLTTDMQNGK